MFNRLSLQNVYLNLLFPSRRIFWGGNREYYFKILNQTYGFWVEMNEWIIVV
jgi:hypothetical protein